MSYFGGRREIVYIHKIHVEKNVHNINATKDYKYRKNKLTKQNIILNWNQNRVSTRENIHTFNDKN